MKKRILIYGDSNVWGYTPGGGRLSEDQQWVHILQRTLGSGTELLQQGLPARVAGNYEAAKPYLNGQAAFEAILRTSLPLARVVIALGTNDLKSGYGRSVDDIVKDLMWYREVLEPIDADLSQTILYVLPPNFTYREGGMSEEVRSGVLDIMMKQLSPDNYVLANTIGISKDGVHFTPEGHRGMAELVQKHLV